MILVPNQKVYDVLKYIARYVLPAFGTLYFALAGIWGFPYGEEVIGTTAALNIFLAAVLGISNAEYKEQGLDTDGILVIDNIPESAIDSFINFDKSEEAISAMKTVKLTVINETDEKARYDTE